MDFIREEELEMYKILLKFIRIFRQYLFWLWRQEGSAGERARGLALGVFAGCFPLFGFQIALGVFLAMLMKGNRVLAASGTLISNPITYLPLYWFNYQIGSLFLGHHLVEPLYAETTSILIWSRSAALLCRLLLGSALTGFVSAWIIGLIAYLFFGRLNLKGRYRNNNY